MVAAKIKNGYSPLKEAIRAAPKLKSLKSPKKMNLNLPNISSFLGPRTTASSAAEGRLKVAASSKYKSKLKSLISKSKKKKSKPTPYLNTSS